MSGKTMLILIGGRSAVPTISGVLQFLDDICKIKFLVCEGEAYENLQRIAADFIKSRKKDIDFMFDRDVKVVNPNDFTQVLIALADLISKEDSIAFASVASAPQTMSIASYAFLEKHFLDVNIFTISTDQSAIIPLRDNEPLILFEKKLNVEDYIAACGLSIHERKADKSFAFRNQDRLKELVYFFAENIESVDPVLTEIRRQAGRSGDLIKSIRSVNLSDEEILKSNIARPFLNDFLKKLAESDLISKLDTSIEVSFRVNPDSYAFLQGDWLELLVYIRALECGFDSLEPALEISDYNGEIDLFCLHNSNALICECKSGKWDKKSILKLRNLAEKLGESYCTKILITSAIKVSDELEQEAKNSKVKLFNGKDLFKISELLKREMDKPTYARR